MSLVTAAARAAPDDTYGRAADLFDAHDAELGSSLDRMFAALLLVEWLAGITLAGQLAPRAGEGAPGAGHLQIWAALLLGGVLAWIPAALGAWRPGRISTRHAIAVGQMLMGALFLQLSGGRGGVQLFALVSLAFLASYRDAGVLLTASAVVLAQHLGGGALPALSSPGAPVAGSLGPLAPTFWLVFEDVFLIMSCLRGRREMRDHADGRGALERDRHESALAARASHESRELLAGLSREVRAPMATILGSADLLMEHGIDASARLNHVQTIRRQGEHLLAVLDDIRDFSTIEAGTALVDVRACSPSQVVVAVASLMRPRAAEKGLVLEIRFATPVPEVIHSDPDRLRQILGDLVGNGLDATVVGGVRITVRCDDPGSARPRLVFAVADTGAGLSAKEVVHAFEPVVHAETSRAARASGTGLRLAICERFARLLDGELTVESTKSRGSTFTLTLDTGPLDGVRMCADLQEAGASIAAEERAAEGAPRLAGLHVLLAEDGPDNQRLVSAHLTRAGAGVTIVDNGRLALERALAAADAGRPFDVVLMDMQMPELDGYGATSRLRSKGYALPIIALTARGATSDRERCLAAGCDDYVTKPIHRGDLCEAILRATAPRESGEEEITRPVVPIPSVPPPPAGTPFLGDLADDPRMQILVAEFVAELPLRSAAIRIAAERLDPDELERLAHQLKGSAGGYGFGAITAVAGELERAVAARVELREVWRRVDELSDLCARASSRAA